MTIQDIRVLYRIIERYGTIEVKISSYRERKLHQYVVSNITKSVNISEQNNVLKLYINQDVVMDDKEK